MDYVFGGVAALISGNVTPNRPKVVKRALTPTKHQPSPNVTPKSQVVDDRSVFLSPSVQKKKAIIKKSPKRIFQAANLDETDDGASAKVPKGDKAKKHLKNELESSSKGNNVTDPTQTNSPKKKSKKKQKDETEHEHELEKPEININKLQLSVSEENASVESQQSAKSKKKNKKNRKKQSNNNTTQDDIENENGTSMPETENGEPKKKKNKSKRITEEIIPATEESEPPDTKESKKKKKSKETELIVNPNAITDKDSDSEHESDNEINSDQSDDEEIEEPAEEAEAAAANSSDDEEDKKESQKKEKPVHVVDETEVKRTIFVGNVPFSPKCKKQIKKIFSKHGQIETIRIRTVPVKDGTMTPKLAVIKNELHPECNTVNVYVKFKDISSAQQALCENNSQLASHHLRVSAAGAGGAEHDPRRAVYVGNVPFGCADDTLRERFAKCGLIQSVRIVRDRKTNAGKGFGYVNFESIDAVELALGLSDEDLTIKNRIMRVQRCNPGRGKQQQQQQQQQTTGKPWARQGPPQHRGQKNQMQNGRGPPQSRGPLQKSQFQNTRGPNNRGPSQRPQSQGSGQGQRQRREGPGSTPAPADSTQGAYRRIKKRKSEENGEGPPKEKKQKKEFVGVTAEKKKKQKSHKGEKKKKALSEILTK